MYANIIRQLNNLSRVGECFLYDGKIYERLYKDEAEKKEFNAHAEYKLQHKYRFFLSCDDYDYVTDPKLVRKLNAFLKTEEKFLKKIGL